MFYILLSVMINGYLEAVASDSSQHSADKTFEVGSQLSTDTLVEHQLSTFLK